MKPFDLEAFKQGAVGITRGGYEVTFVAHVPEAHELHRLVYMRSTGCIDRCTEDGLYYIDARSVHDIVGLKTQTKTYWVNLYESSCYGYESKERADKTLETRRINGKAYKVEIEL